MTVVLRPAWDITATLRPGPVAAATPLAVRMIAPPSPPGWFDDFSGDLSTLWVAKTHNYRPTYPWRDDPSKCAIVDGVLSLTCANEGGNAYAASTVYSKRTFNHGYFEARMKWPMAYGIDASFWLVLEGGTNPRPELDILEAYANEPYVYPGPNRYQSTMHHPLNGIDHPHQITYDHGSNMTDDWHVIGCNWVSGTSLEFFCDGVSTGPPMTTHVLKSTDPQVAMNLYFSYFPAVWPAQPDGNTPASATMLVDWVKWWDVKP